MSAQRHGRADPRAGGWARRVGVAALCTLVLIGLPQDASGQILKRIKERARERVDQRAQEGVEQGLTKAEEIVVCIVTDATCIEQAEAEGQAVQVTDANGVPMTGGAEVALPPGEGAWTNYDFVPGERVLFAEDFSRDNVGDFPRRMEFRSGSMQVVEWRGRRWLSAEGGELYVTLPEALPERFTLEFELAGRGNPMTITFDGGATNRAPGRLNLAVQQARLISGDVHAEGAFDLSTAETPLTIRIAVDGSYLKLYANERRVLNVPNAQLGRSDRIFVHMNGWSAEEPRLITNLRIAAGGNDLYAALAAEGRVATQGILFDTGSDRIRPESTPTLTEIGQMLQQYPELRLAIEGHTDDAGDDAANLVLSQSRAEAVRQYLMDRHGIAPERLVPEGHGENRPVAPNDTPEGRQQNRRVELVRTPDGPDGAAGMRTLSWRN